MAVRIPDYRFVRSNIPIEPVDATEALLASVQGIRVIQATFEKYIRAHTEELTAPGHRPKIEVYLEASKVMPKAVDEIVAAQAKLSEWVGAEELRRLVVQTFEQLPVRLEAWVGRSASRRPPRRRSGAISRRSRGGSSSCRQARGPTLGKLIEPGELGLCTPLAPGGAVGRVPLRRASKGAASMSKTRMPRPDVRSSPVGLAPRPVERRDGRECFSAACGPALPSEDSRASQTRAQQE